MVVVFRPPSLVIAVYMLMFVYMLFAAALFCPNPRRFLAKCAYYYIDKVIITVINYLISLDGLAIHSHLQIRSTIDRPLLKTFVIIQVCSR